MKHPTSAHLAAFTVIVLCASTAFGAPLIGPVINPANGHTYYLLGQNTWTGAEAEAVSLGGHLATINDAAENQWITSTFSNPYYYLWIGLNDAAVEGQFVWASGEPVTYENWYPGEPNNLNGENYAAIYNFDSGFRQWNDWSNRDSFDAFPFYAVAEIAAVPDKGNSAALLALGLLCCGFVHAKTKTRERHPIHCGSSRAWQALGEAGMVVEYTAVRYPGHGTPSELLWGPYVRAGLRYSF